MDNKCFTAHGMAIFGFKSYRCCKQWCLILLKQRSLHLSVLSSASHQGCFFRYILYTPVDIYAYTQDSNQLAILVMARFNKDTATLRSLMSTLLGHLMVAVSPQISAIVSTTASEAIITNR